MSYNPWLSATHRRPSFSYHYMEVWASDALPGMTANKPLFQRAYLEGTVHEVFQDGMKVLGGCEEASSMEVLLDLLGIEYSHAIYGYCLKQQASLYHEEFCALDWYYQSAEQRRISRNKWEHRFILDQVCPSSWYLAKIIEDAGEYEGWEERAKGQGQLQVGNL